MLNYNYTVNIGIPLCFSESVCITCMFILSYFLYINTNRNGSLRNIYIDVIYWWFKHSILAYIDNLDVNLRRYLVITFNNDRSRNLDGNIRDYLHAKFGITLDDVAW
jgi:hypothetical protein